MNLSTKQKETHRHREQTCGCQGETVLWERWIDSLESAYVNKYIQSIEWINNEVFLYSIGNYSVSCDKLYLKEYEKGCIYIYIYIFLNLFAVQQK